MIILFTGAHGSGKTELCKRLSEKMSLPFFESRAAQIHRDHGVTGGADIPFDLRMTIQQAILQSWLDQFREAKTGGGVFDRCPLDFVAYTLADAQRVMPVQHIGLADAYIQSCLEAAALNRGIMFFTRPLDGVKSARGEDKPDTANTVYATLIDMIITGLLARHQFPCRELPATTIEQRMNMITVALDAEFNTSAQRFISGWAGVGGDGG